MTWFIFITSFAFIWQKKLQNPIYHNNKLMCFQEMKYRKKNFKSGVLKSVPKKGAYQGVRNVSFSETFAYVLKGTLMQILKISL